MGNVNSFQQISQEGDLDTSLFVCLFATCPRDKSQRWRSLVDVEWLSF